MASHTTVPVARAIKVAESELVVAVCRSAAILIGIFLAPGYLSPAPPRTAATLVVISASVYNAALLVAYWRGTTFKGMRIATVAADMGFVTLWVYIASPTGDRLFGLYYVLVVVAALWFGVIGTTATAATGAGLYLLALHAGGTGAADFERAMTQQIPVLVLAAVVAGYMADAQRREREAWNRDRVALAQYEGRRRIIQEFYERLTPQRLPSVPGLDVGLRFRPALRMGAGDYYDLLTITPGRYLVVVADVAGKYAGSLMQVPFLKFSLLAAARAGRSPAGILAQVNDNMFPQPDEDADRIISACCALLDVQAATFTYASAGHDPPLLIRERTKEALTLERGDLVMGVQPGIAYQEETVPLEPGDTVVLCTDGVIEATDARDQQFGLEGLQAAAVAGVGLGLQADELARQLFLQVRDFARGGQRDDDMTLMVLRFRPPQG
jgi:serine phosphatase RsbU (regulator of sigma subunit)